MIRRIVTAITILAGATLSAQTQTPAATTGPSLLPVTRVVLYKSGVGYFEHLTSVTGNQALAVQFTAEQLDDVLKSLSALDLGNGRIVGVSYDSPTPVARRLQALTLPLRQNEPTMGLLAALRGTRVDLRGGAAAPLAGRLLNVERRQMSAGEKAQQWDEVSLLTDAGDIVTVTITPQTRVHIADGAVRQEVGRYLGLATSNAERVPRRVVIATAGTGTRQVLVGYVGEAAVWKSTYRLIFPLTGGKPVLQGWGVVDNVSASDWTNVELSLVAGAPQAFRQPLSLPLFATRPFVPVPMPASLAPQVHEAAIADGATRLAGNVTDTLGRALPGARVSVVDGALVVASVVTDAQGNYAISGVQSGVFNLHFELMGFTTVASSVTLSPGTQATRNAQMSPGMLEETITVAGALPAARGAGRGPGAAGGAYAAPPPPPAPSMLSRSMAEQQAFGQDIAVAGSDLGDLFEYRLRDKVTIARNQSALVPILQTRIDAERVSLWNAAMGRRPRRSIWLTNSSDLTLDAGSLSIVDTGSFAGEGLVELTKPGERRLISYAADLAVTVVARDEGRPTRVSALRIAKGVLIREVEERRERTYTIRNNDRDSRTVVIEHPIDGQWKLARSVVPDESTPSVHRLRLSVPPGETKVLAAPEAREISTTITIGQITPETLVSITEVGDQRAALQRVLAPIFAKQAEYQKVGEDMSIRQGEIQSIGEDQVRVRDNMGALKGTAEERSLTERYVRQLSEQENRLDILKKELAGLQTVQMRVGQELAALIEALSLDERFKD